MNVYRIVKFSFHLIITNGNFSFQICRIRRISKNHDFSFVNIEGEFIYVELLF